MIDPVTFWRTGWAVMLGQRQGAALSYSNRAFYLSFIALLFALPVAALAAFAAARQAVVAEVQIMPLPLLAVAFLIASLTFAPLAALLAFMFKRMDKLKDWITLRHWMWLAALLVAAAPFALHLAGLLPYTAAVFISSILFPFIIWVDYRLSKSLLELTWIGALASACIISCGFLWAILMSGLFLSYVPLSG